MTKQLPESERRVLELHVAKARDLAMRLFAVSGTIYPEGWTRSFVEPVVLELFEFVFHARRVEELTGILVKEKPEMLLSRYSIVANEPSDLCKC